MIISASRRTDIPAFYSKWFINRIRAGWCQVPNPVNYNQLSYVSLKPEDVGAIVYFIKAIPWTVPGFDINKNMHDLEKLQRKLYAGERLVYTQVRFLFQAEKPC